MGAVNGSLIHSFVQSACGIPHRTVFAHCVRKCCILQRDCKIGHGHGVPLLRVGAVQLLEAPVFLLHGGGVIHQKDRALTEIEVRVQFVLAGLHQLLE